MPRLLILLALSTSLFSAEEGDYSQTARDIFLRQFPEAKITLVREQSHNSNNLINLWTYNGNAANSYKVQASDPYNKSIEAEFTRTGKLVKLDAAKIPYERAPDAVRKSAEDTYVKVKWAALVECEKIENTVLYFTLKGKHGDKKVSVRITESGEIIRKSK